VFDVCWQQKLQADPASSFTVPAITLTHASAKVLFYAGKCCQYFRSKWAFPERLDNHFPDE
jgi:hypothetical protein